MSANLNKIKLKCFLKTSKLHLFSIFSCGVDVLVISIMSVSFISSYSAEIDCGKQ